MRKRTLLYSLLTSLLFCSLSFGQESEVSTEPANLNARFGELKDNAETYNEYKVIKAIELNSFWKITQDSLKTVRESLSATKELLATELAKTEDLTGQLDKTKSDLQKSSFDGDHMSFLGISLHKTTYVLFLWIGMAVLAGLIGVLFTRLRYSMSIEKKTKKEIGDISDELRTAKSSALEKEMKLKRELQTAINSLDEYKSKGGNRF